VAQRNKGGSTALHAAAQQGRAACVEALLAARADPLARDLGGETPLECARRLGQADAVAVLGAQVPQAARPSPPPSKPAPKAPSAASAGGAGAQDGAGAHGGGGWEAWKAKGNSAYDAGAFAEAARCYGEGLRLDPRNAALLSNRCGPSSPAAGRSLPCPLRASASLCRPPLTAGCTQLGGAAARGGRGGGAGGRGRSGRARARLGQGAAAQGRGALGVGRRVRRPGRVPPRYARGPGRQARLGAWRPLFKIDILKARARLASKKRNVVAGRRSPRGGRAGAALEPGSKALQRGVRDAEARLQEVGVEELAGELPSSDEDGGAGEGAGAGDGADEADGRADKADGKDDGKVEDKAGAGETLAGADAAAEPLGGGGGGGGGGAQGADARLAALEAAEAAGGEAWAGAWLEWRAVADASWRETFSPPAEIIYEGPGAATVPRQEGKAFLDAAKAGDAPGLERALLRRPDLLWYRGQGACARPSARPGSGLTAC